MLSSLRARENQKIIRYYRATFMIKSETLAYHLKEVKKIM